MWDQNIRMKEMKGHEAIASKEKKLRPLFTQGEGMKRDKGETLWNCEGRQFFSEAVKTWTEIYNSKEKMKIIYNKWERWITTKGKQIRIGEGKKTFHSVMGTWNNTRVASLKKRTIVWMSKNGMTWRVGIILIQVARGRVWVGEWDC